MVLSSVIRFPLSPAAGGVGNVPAALHSRQRDKYCCVGFAAAVRIKIFVACEMITISTVHRLGLFRLYLRHRDIKRREQTIV